MVFVCCGVFWSVRVLCWAIYSAYNGSGCFECLSVHNGCVLIWDIGFLLYFLFVDGESWRFFRIGSSISALYCVTRLGGGHWATGWCVADEF